jgi:two-component system response regulator PilR (NtrC family)
MQSGVLFVSPYSQDARSLAQMLHDVSLPLIHANSLKEAASKLETDNFQVILTEANLEDGTWLDVLRIARLTNTELIVTDPWADARFWAEAISMGAYDLLAQPFFSTEVRRVLTTASGRKSSVKAHAAA